MATKLIGKNGNSKISDIYVEGNATKKAARGIESSGAVIELQLYDENTLGFAPENVAFRFPGGLAYNSIAGSTNGVTISGLGENSTRIPTDKGYSAQVEVLPQEDTISNTALAKTNTTFEEANISFNAYEGKAYSFEIEVIVTAAAGGGHKYQLDGDAVIATMSYTIESLNLTTGLFTISDHKTAMASPSGNTNVSLGTMRTTIKGTISDVTTTGSVYLYFAQNAAVGTSTLVAGGFRKIRFALLS
jgi:hypothetical protein